MIRNINLQWFPGHMTKTKRLIEANLKNCDIVIEILDARIPISSKNPIISDIIGNKPRLVLLNKSDISDMAVNNMWIDYFKKNKIKAILINSITKIGFNRVEPALKEILKEKIQREKAKGMEKSIKAMVVGIPNAGKSSFINKVAGKKAAKVEDRPGVTRTMQWIKISPSIELIDMPGMLWPKFEKVQTGLNLAYTGAIKDDIIDIESLACYFLEDIVLDYENLLKERYKIDESIDLKTLQGYEILEIIGKNRGFLISGGEIDYERTSKIVLDEFRGEKIGKISLERPKEED